MISEDKYIEMLAAALQRATIPDADVQWNVKVGNRQFDVLATIAAGMHKILVGYEVKNKTRPVAVDAVDAFVTKTRDAGVNKAVFVSRSGFQSGAITVAAKHNIDLFQIDLLPDGLPGISETSAHLVISRGAARPFEGLRVSVVDESYRTNAVETIHIIYEDGRVITLPDEPSQMTYLVTKSKFRSGQSLKEVIDPVVDELIPLGTIVDRSISVRDHLIPPDEYFLNSGKTREIKLVVRGIEAVLLSSNATVELTTAKSKVRYANLATGEHTEVPAHQLPVGGDSFRVGAFYFTYEPLIYYYCDRIDGDIAQIYLVESFQSGELLQAHFKLSTKYSRFYIELTDRRIITRLEARLRKLKQ
jgi:hypothetical protein